MGFVGTQILGAAKNLHCSLCVLATNATKAANKFGQSDTLRIIVGFHARGKCVGHVRAVPRSTRKALECL